MNKFIIYFNEQNRILEYMLPGEDNRQGEIDLSAEMKVPELIIAYEVWDGEWFFRSNDYVRLSVEHQIMESFPIIDGKVFNIKIKSSGRKLTGVAHLINEEMTTYTKYDISKLNHISIGRNQGNDITINNDFVSGQHASINFRGNGWYISNNSPNGTYLNSDRISGEQKLHIGDSIYIVGFKIIFFGSFIAINRIKEVEARITEYDSSLHCEKRKSEDESSFSRAPRYIEPLDESPVEIEGPPQKERQSKQPLWLVLGPSLTMPLPILVVVLFNALSNKGGSVGSYIGMLLSVVMFAGLGFFWTMMRTRYDKKNKYENEQIRVASYGSYISQNDEYIGQKLAYNKNVLNGKYKSSVELASLIPVNKVFLWNRNVNHDDFLTVRIGTGYIKSPVEVKVPAQRFSIEQDELVLLPGQIKQKYDYIADGVKTLDLRKNKIIGVIGDNEGINTIARNLIIQLAALHSYTDLRIALLYENYDIEWAKWLPHCFSSDKKVRFIGNDESSVQSVIYALTNELRMRAENTEVGTSKTKYKNHFVVFVSDKKFFENETIQKYMVSEEDYGFTFVLLYGTVTHLPNECNYIIEKRPAYNGIYVLTEAYDITKNVQFDDISSAEAEKFARFMSKYYISEVSEGQIPDAIDYFSMLGIERLDEWNLIKNYKQNRAYEGLPSFVGLAAGGKPLFLDIHEKKHGPHGLVAGTTGSGKSETIQTFILSLLMNYSPDEVAFILIDYKGGGMANAFLGLPHIAGTITNLGTGTDATSNDSVDPNQMRRALISIRSEIKRRQAILNKYKVNHVDLYMRLFREHKAEEPLPHLIIISDEFAELKKEQPGFIRELVSTARVGRSLGIHLILATQKPAGVVDEEIWSNSRFKLCLRVQDKQDSMEMLKRPEAAFLTQSGRAYLQIGHDEIFEMFQSGYSGAKYDPSVEVKKTAEGVNMIGIDGSSLIVRQRGGSGGESKITQLEACVSYITKMAEVKGIKPTRPLWKPALGDKIFIEDILKNENIDTENRLVAVIGMIDEPERQLVEPLIIDIERISNMLIAGLNGSGKTTVIKTIISSMVRQYSSAYVQFYIMDFSARTLKIFRSLPHVGDVFYPEETEGIERTIKFAFDEITNRTSIFQKDGIGSFIEYNEVYKEKPLPCLVFVIDNFFDFMTEYSSYEEDILKLTRDGSRYGIQFIITVNRASDVRYKLRQNFTCFIPLRLLDKADYLDMLGKNPEFLPSAITGRGLINMDGNLLEFQAALPAFGDTESERNTIMKEVFSEIREKNMTAVAKKIPVLPTTISYLQMLEGDAADTIARRSIPAGYDSESIELVEINPENDYCYVVWGTSKDAVCSILSMYFAATVMNGSIINVIVAGNNAEKIYGDNSCLKYEGYQGLYDFLVKMRGEFKKRSDRKKEYINEGLKNEKEIVKRLVDEYGELVVFVDDLIELCALLYDPDNNAPLSPLYEMFMKQGAGLGIMFLFGVSGELPSKIAGFKTVKLILEYRKGICFGGMLNLQKLFTFDISYNVQTKKMPDNIGYTIKDGKSVRIFLPENLK